MASAEADTARSEVVRDSQIRAPGLRPGSLVSSGASRSSAASAKLDACLDHFSLPIFAFALSTALRRSDATACRTRTRRGRQPRGPRLAPAAAATTLSFQVTDALGAPLSDVQVTTQAPIARDGVTAARRLVAVHEYAGGNLPRAVRAQGLDYSRARRHRPRWRIAGGRRVAECGTSVAKAPEPVKPAVPEPATKVLPPPGEPKVTPSLCFSRRISSAASREGLGAGLHADRDGDTAPASRGVDQPHARRCRRVDLCGGR